jgi:activator of 2-hydroxyglutaryl-CoA dehydratase
MSIFLGIDIGTVSVKIALVSDESSRDTLLRASIADDLFCQPSHQEKIEKSISSNLLVTKCHRIKGNPLQGTYQLLKGILEIIPLDQIGGVRTCGSGGKLVGELLGINNENEFRALTSGVGELYPHISTIFEMGGQISKYLSLERDVENYGGEVWLAPVSEWIWYTNFYEQQELELNRENFYTKNLPKHI